MLKKDMLTGGIPASSKAEDFTASAEAAQAAAKKALAAGDRPSEENAAEEAAREAEEAWVLTTPELKEALIEHLENNYHTSFESASTEDMYKALAEIVNEQLRRKKWAFNRVRKQALRSSDDKKKIYYISMEFLMGQSLKNNLYNLGETETAGQVLAERGVSLEDLYDCEPDAGLGNGGLGRLAACYMDAIATQGYDCTGFSIRYEYGLFKQKIVDGWQVEMPDNWLPGGRVWLNERSEDTFEVSFYGDYKETWTDQGFGFELKKPEVVEAVPYDMLVSGADSSAVAKLRLWRGTSLAGFDMAAFNAGDFTNAAQATTQAELLSKVLYPADNIEEGKELRLKQQYFMVSASCQNIIRDHLRLHGTLDNFDEKVAIHINDTHPALVIPELMRLLMDEHGLDWDTAWRLTTRTVSYTNHTVLSEALEKWGDSLVRRMLPRIYSILKEIDRRFRLEMDKRFPGDTGKINYMSLLGDGQVRMANLAVIGSHRVNGVSELHSEILKDDLFHDFYLAWPEKFTNVTNGIAYRRWLCQANPRLAALLDDCIGSGYRLHPLQLTKFLRYHDDPQVQQEVEKIKRANKTALVDRIARTGALPPDPDSVFIVQAKRVHEYKRQLMNALRIISRYQMLQDNPDLDMRPETYLFAAKSAPSYYLAKYIIQLICKLGQEIDQNPKIRKKLRVLFLENYSVSMAERLMPASDISEQISLAGKEASGTGNMKLMINGAITIGTLDGANVEMRNAVTDDNIFIFGQRADEAAENLRNGYNARACYEQDPVLKRTVDALDRGFCGQSFSNLKNYLLEPSYSVADPYMCLMDFHDYCRAHEEMRKAYEVRPRWNSMAITNIAMAARFAADRSVKEYGDYIWHTKPIVKEH